MKLFILGFMGCGKTKLGKKIAHHLRVPFIDLDQKIEDQNNQSITRLFKEIGEERFREIEQQSLIEVINENSDFVLSVGGGTPCFFNNMDLMNQSGKTIYLKLPPEVLYGRLRSAKENRPLIANLSDGELKIFVSNKLLEREKYYSLAQVIDDSTNKSPKQIISLI